MSKKDEFSFANTAPHEEMISRLAKSSTSRALALLSSALNEASPHIEGEDPLRAERYTQLAVQLSEVAATMHRLGEDARSASTYISLFQEVKEKPD